MIKYQIKLTALIIIIAALAAGVAFLGWRYYEQGAAVRGPDLNINEQAGAGPQATPEQKSYEQVLQEMNKKAGTLEYCDYYKGYSAEDYDMCIQGLAYNQMDSSYCDLITDEKMKRDCLLYTR